MLGDVSLDADALVRRERSHTVQAYGSRQGEPIVLVDAEGVEVVSADGRRLLDFSAQTASCAIGYRHPVILDRLRRQLEVAVASPAHVHAGRVELAERLAAESEGELTRCWFGVSGSDAVEAALMFARLRPGRWKVISHYNGYHGSTLGALSAHGIGAMRRRFEPLLPGFVHVHPPDTLHGAFPSGCDVSEAALTQLRDVVLEEGPEQIAAVLIEPVFAGGGVIVPPESYLRGLRSLCDAFGILLVYDEVVTGIGRTGAMFGYMHSGAVPDMLVLGKGLTSGYQALSAVLVRASADPFGTDGSSLPLHLHTMAGNPMGCAAALATLDIIASERLVENAAARGEELTAGLQSRLGGSSRVTEIRGQGLLVGVELDPRGSDPKALETRAVRACLDRGLIVYGSSGPYAVLVLHPPLSVGSDDVARAVDAIASAVETLD
jgi:adenosylmethionine-8-amino-7-oxononanoate aminotransferase